MALKYNPLLEDNFQELNPAGPGGGVSLAATLILGNTTGGADIVLSGSGLTADTIKGIGTTHSMNLNGPFGGWSISSDDAAFNESYVFGDSSSAYLAFGLSEFVATANSILMKNLGGSMIGQPFSYLSATNIGIADNAAVGIIYSIKIKSSGTSSSSTVSDAHIFINSGGVGLLASIINTGVLRSVVVAGKGITAKTDDTLYTNQISLQPSGNTFDGMLEPSAITADRAWTMPDKSGTVAMLSDIAGGSYVQTGTTTNATPLLLTGSFAIPNNSVQSFVTRITAIQSATTGAGTVGDVWVHEFRGAVKNISGVSSNVDTPIEESLAEDVGANWIAQIQADFLTSEFHVTVWGQPSKTIKWKAETVFNEVLI